MRPELNGWSVATDPEWKGSSNSTDPDGYAKAGESATAVGGLLLVAAEEARSSASGQHAQVAARANAARA
ncbi:MAG: hypothetical protein WAM85_01655 [Terracidiphilus sp.]